METFIAALLSAVAGSIVSGAVMFGRGKTAAYKQAKAEADKKREAELEVLKALARKEIIDFHAQYVVGDSKMTIERYEEIHRLFDAYTVLGGNGTAKTFMKDITAKRPYIVND